MKILFVTSETAPFFGKGGLTDVVYGLGKELNVQGQDVRVVVPRYRNYPGQINDLQVLRDLPVNLGSYSRTGHLSKLQNGLTFYFVDQDFYFNRDDYYGYADDYERFIFFTRFALQMLITEAFQESEDGWFPDIIQGYDWVSGLIPGWLPQYRAVDERFNSVRFVLFPHNIRRLGRFSSRALSLAKQEDCGFFPALGESSKEVNFLGRGVQFADAVITTNANFSLPTNKLPVAAASLAGALAQQDQAGRMHSIPSGIDVEIYDPNQEDTLKEAPYQPYTYSNLDKRAKNKLALQDELGFRPDAGIPLLGMVSRLVPENGLDLLKALEQQRHRLGDFQLVILAEPGDQDYQQTVKDWEDQQDGQNPWIKSRFAYSKPLVRRIYASCDLYLLPVQEQPNGINQLIAMHYGALPVAHNTGSISSTVINHTSGIKLSSYNGQDRGIGFTFDHYTAESFLQALERGLSLYRSSPAIWRQMQVLNMRARFAWDVPAASYLDVYTDLLTQPAVEIQPGQVLTINKEDRLLQALEEIGSLPGMQQRESQMIWQQAARLVRWVLGCDAVYVREMERQAQLKAENGGSGSKIISSLARRPLIEGLAAEKDVAEMLRKCTQNTWKHLGDVDRQGLCQAIEGLGDEKIARQAGWGVGWSVPVWAHGRLLGWVDTLFDSSPEDPDWVVSALTSLANGAGMRVDSIRITKELDTVSAIGQNFLLAQTQPEVIEKACRWISEHLPGSQTFVYEAKRIEGQVQLTAAAPDAPEAAKALTNTAYQRRRVVYDSDWSRAPRGVDRRRLYRSVLAVPVLPTQSGLAPAASTDELRYILVVVNSLQAAFTRDDEQMLANHLIPHVYQALRQASAGEEKDQRRAVQMEKLVNSTVAGADFNTLLQRVTDTIADVLEASAAALYLLNDETGRLEIRAANGYQRTFLDKKVSYAVGEGLTGWIVDKGEIVAARNQDELHVHPGWRGQRNKDYNVQEPNAFLGIPLIIREAASRKIIGVLKVEDRKESHPITYFAQEDIRLGEMMANVIATVIYNARHSENSLRVFSNNLDALSAVLVGSRDLPTLMDRIVKKIADVLKVDAASLYLADENQTELVIQAAAGYQEPLVEKKVRYKWGQGVTGKIAATQQPVITKSVIELRTIGGNPRGAFDDYHIKQEQPESFYGLPLMVKDEKGNNKVIGVLKVESTSEYFFSSEDELLIRMMANVIATVVYNAQQSEKRLENFSQSLSSLAEALAGSRDLPALMDNIIKKIASELDVDAASLYLADENETELVIQAAAGYQEPLVKEKARYKWGQGVTGRIAATQKPVIAKSVIELRDIGGTTRGAYDDYHIKKEQPESFYGLPLMVKDEAGSVKVIGVLKVESIKQRFFSSEDVLLIEMMANVIATVVYNAQKSDLNLRKFSKNLRDLSVVLAGGRDLPTLMDSIIKTINNVLHLDAASLYLADEKETELVIQAAAGYQEPLVKEKARYKWGQGVTGTIASSRQKVITRSLSELRTFGKSSSGNYDNLHKDKKQPQSFYGLPLIVKDEVGRDKVIGVLKMESIKEYFFSSEAELLIEMMANVISTVVYNTQKSDKNIGFILSRLGSLSAPEKQVVPDLLGDLARSSDEAVLDQFSRAIAAMLNLSQISMESESRALFEAHAQLSLYERIANTATKDHVRWYFNLLHHLFQNPQSHQTWDEVVRAITPWLNLRNNAGDIPAFHEASSQFAAQIAAALDVKAGRVGIDKSGSWFGVVVNTHAILGSQKPAMPLIFHRVNTWSDEDQDFLRVFVLSGFGVPYNTGALVLWDDNVSQEQVKGLQDRLRIHAIDLVVMTIKDVLGLLELPDPAELFHGLVLRQSTHLTPFNITGPVPDTLFFGRVQEMADITQHLGAQRSCALIGGRRIGKTSVLQRLHRHYLPSRSFRSIYFDCSNINSYQEFLDQAIPEWRPEAPTDFPKTFGDLFDNPPTDKPLVLLLDESDGMVHIDRKTKWHLFNRLRGLINSHKLQVVLCGEQSLRTALRDDTSPLFNMINDLVLGRLEPHDVKDLVIRPMRALEIDLEDPDTIVEKICDATLRHPNVVQRLCARLAERMNGKQLHKITPADVDEVVSDPTFQRDDLMLTYWAGASVLEKALSLMIIKNPALSSPRDLRNVLKETYQIDLDIRSVNEALQNLVSLRSIMQYTPSGYAIAVKPLEKVLENVLEDLLAQYIEDLQSGAGAGIDGEEDHG